MKRRRAREYALQLLFQLDVTGGELTDELLRDFWKNIKEDDDDKEFADSLIRGTREHIAEIDKIIKKSAEHWSIDRMAIIDRNIIRCAAYELLYRADIPPSVTINEALEISKKYSSEDSASFVNGILDKIQKMKDRY
jgi:N utilization substance protein B